MQYPPFEPRVQVCEATAVRPGAVIILALSPGGNPRRVTVAEAREFLGMLTAAIERVESGAKLPAVPQDAQPKRK